MLVVLVASSLASEASVSRTKKWMEGSNRVKEKRRAALMKKILSNPVPDSFKPDQDSPAQHKKDAPNVILTVGMSVNFMKDIATMFTKTARNAGFEGDIVVAVAPGSREGFLKTLRLTNSVIYTIDLHCVGNSDNDKRCSIEEGDDDAKVPIAMLRFYMYNWWARQYNSKTEIMISDFKDVFFQSNPFTYKRSEWAHPVSDFTAFLEHHPNKVIGRCGHNRGWISNCYGEKGLKAIESETVSCSGVSIATQEGLLVYTHLMIEQLDISSRYIYDKEIPSDASQKRCLALGMDQGFHNFILYTGQLERYMNVKMFQQGEGPVNTVGAFVGKAALIKMPLKQWGVAKEEKDNLVSIFNWNGDRSPAVHQFDRFLNSDEFPHGSYGKMLTVAEKAIKDIG